ncbi:hypothetical protein A2V68_00805 [candidate division Kazan bacterium RBG_13_50_9]|uniref:ABC transporter substrate-binding protein n=1 Tax=candidate division Kazan bacterium RBG_13_50_9 TaxID=1798535 RepID=A0A1F4NSE1_UNCK3|nr:MAG: hypothetical protein A2V68_00805 [candidate division Kazan bacterium RBG_13_50_9]
MKNLARYTALGLAIAVILGAASCGRRSDSGDKIEFETKQEVVLQYDRLWDEDDVLDEIIQEYQDEHPNVSIIVRKVNLKPEETIYDYQKDLIKQIADGAGPDMFMIHSDWLPYHKNQIAPMPSALMEPDQYAQNFPQVAVEDFIDSNKIYAIPYYVDNLMLFYNTRIFDDLRIRKPPRTWQEVVDLIPKLTKYGPNDTIIQSALPLGVADGIPRFAEILATLIMQYGGEMTTADHAKATFDLPAPDSNPPYFSGKEALSFYTSFANPSSSTYTYTDAKNRDGSRQFPIDIQAFMDEKAAMFIGYSYHVEDIKKFAPGLRFETAPLPQLRLENPTVIANYWGETVSKNSKYPNEAWDFINFVAQRRNIDKYTRAAKHVPALKEKRESYVSRQYYGPIAQQIDYSRSWYRQNTPEIEAIFERMVDSVLHYDVDPSTAINTAVRDINNLI